MKLYEVYGEVLGTWFEKGKRMDGVVDLKPYSGRFLARDGEEAVAIAKTLGHKIPIVGEVNHTH